MEEPVGVPDDAAWSEKDQEWVQGNERGTGTVRYWRADGSLVCVSEFVDGQARTFERYHETGSVSRRGGMDAEGRMDGLDVALRADGPSTEVAFPFPEKVVRFETQWKSGVMLWQRCYDASGTETLRNGDPVPAPPLGLPNDAVWLDGEWAVGGVLPNGAKVGTWVYYDPSGACVEEFAFDPSGTCVRRVVPMSADDDPRVRFHAGPWTITSTQGRERRPTHGRWTGRVERLDAAREPLGSFDPTGAEQVKDSARLALIERVRNVDWASLEAKHRSAERIEGMLVTLVAKSPHEDLEHLFDELWDQLNHQGDVYTASAAAIGPLVELALLEEDAPWRHGYLRLVVRVSNTPRVTYEAYKDEGDGALRAVTVALAEGHTSLAKLLQHDAVATRLDAVQILASSYEDSRATELLRAHEPREEAELAAVLVALGSLGTLDEEHARATMKEGALLVKVAALMGMALQGSHALADTAVPILLEALTQDDDFEKALWRLPRIEDHLVPELTQLFTFYGAEDQRQQVLDAILAALDERAGFGAVTTVEAALAFASGIAEEDEDRYLVEERQILERLVAKDDLWRTSEGDPVRNVNLVEVFEAFGLPDTREELRAHLAGD